MQVEAASNKNADGTSGSRPSRSSQNATLSCVYMLAFNILCTYAWAKVFCVETKHLINHRLPEALYVSAWPELEGPLFFAQSLAVLEVLHSMLGACCIVTVNSNGTKKDNY